MDRMEREKATVAAMIGLFCRARHGTSAALCPECAGLLRYASARLDRCPFGADKPPCSKCPDHCYAPTRQERMREVMRFAGPRMPLRHPVLAAAHLLDNRRRPPGVSEPRKR